MLLLCLDNDLGEFGGYYLRSKFEIFLATFLFPCFYCFQKWALYDLFSACYSHSKYLSDFCATLYVSYQAMTTVWVAVQRVIVAGTFRTGSLVENIVHSAESRHAILQHRDMVPLNSLSSMFLTSQLSPVKFGGHSHFSTLFSRSDVSEVPETCSK